MFSHNNRVNLEINYKINIGKLSNLSLKVKSQRIKIHLMQLKQCSQKLILIQRKYNKENEV